MKSMISFLLCASLRISSVEAFASFLPAGFTSWGFQSSIVANNWLYIDGGEIHVVDSDTGITNSVPNKQTFAIDLSNSWTTSSVTAKAFTRPSTLRQTRRPQLFYDALTDMVYNSGGQCFGDDGNIAVPDAVPKVWGFTTDSEGSVDWTVQTGKPSPDSFHLNSTVEFGLTASSSKSHYSLGGFMTFGHDNKTLAPSQIVMDQFLTFDYTTNEFTNQTRSTPHSLDGEAQFIPQYGKEGVLLFFGGRQPTDRSAYGTDFADLGSIQVYDIHTGKFYIQEAANAPIGRARACSVSVSSADNSSQEIFFYGGDTGNANAANVAALSKVYILTIPSFTWIEVPTPASTWRSVHTCQLVGPASIANQNQRQMLSIGGVMSPMPNGQTWQQYHDEWTSGMEILDLSALTWSDSYSATAKAYVRPDLVDKFYAENSAYPTTWGDSALKDIFNNSVAAVTPGTTSTPTPTPNPAADDSKSSNVGAIVGGVVGGVGGLALVGALLWWFVWRRRRSAAPEAAKTQYYDGTEPLSENTRERSELGNTAVISEMQVGGQWPAHELPASGISQAAH